MAQRYSALPSKILFEADTFDIHIINNATAWEQYQRDVAQAKAGKGIRHNACTKGSCRQTTRNDGQSEEERWQLKKFMIE